jgi:hypothetical protein
MGMIEKDKHTGDMTIEHLDALLCAVCTVYCEEHAAEELNKMHPMPSPWHMVAIAESCATGRHHFLYCWIPADQLLVVTSDEFMGGDVDFNAPENKHMMN